MNWVVGVDASTLHGPILQLREVKPHLRNYTVSNCHNHNPSTWQTINHNVTVNVPTTKARSTSTLLRQQNMASIYY